MTRASSEEISDCMPVDTGPFVESGPKSDRSSSQHGTQIRPFTYLIRRCSMCDFKRIFTVLECSREPFYVRSGEGKTRVVSSVRPPEQRGQIRPGEIHDSSGFSIYRALCSKTVLHAIPPYYAIASINAVGDRRLHDRRADRRANVFETIFGRRKTRIFFERPVVSRRKRCVRRVRVKTRRFSHGVRPRA